VPSLLGTRMGLAASEVNIVVALNALLGKVK
jgi:hypothetical protein